MSTDPDRAMHPVFHAGRVIGAGTARRRRPRGEGDTFARQG